MKKQSKMLEGIKVTLELVEAGEYKIEEGKLYNKAGKELGRVGKDSGNVFFVVKGFHIIAGRLMYAHYNGGVEALKEGEVVVHLDENKENNTKENLVQVPRKGMKEALRVLRGGEPAPVVEKPAKPKKAKAKTEVAEEVAPVTIEEPVAVEEFVVAETPVETPTPVETTDYTEAEQEARRMMELLLAGKTIKEVAMEFDVKRSRVADVKRGKSNGKATADLRAEFETM
jgi:hypothetical protein